MKRPKEIALIYLARRHDGIAALDRFIKSYRLNPGGVDHDLVVMFKGFKGEHQIKTWKTRLEEFTYTEFHMGDFGFDIRAYHLASRLVSNRYCCFVNSHSEPLTPNWLGALAKAIAQPGVGAAGATGSWESMYSNLEHELKQAHEISRQRRLWLHFKLQILDRLFFHFPNPHLRTNSFMIRRDLMQSVWPPFAVAKPHAYLWENGRHGFTQLLRDRGLPPVVVGRDGTVYPIENWNRSETFRQGEQANLLVADNQTRLYLQLPANERHQLTHRAWGTSSPANRT